MSKYNVAKKKKPTVRSVRLRATRLSGKRKPNTVNQAGGKAFKTTERYELASLVCTSFGDNKFYESNEAQLKRLRELIQLDPYYAAQSAVFARQVLGSRSISHAVLAEVAATVKGQSWTKDAVIAGVRRPDDITEILAYYFHEYGKPIPNSLRKGLKKSFDKFNAYQLAKYRGDDNEVSLVDAVNLLHPKPVEKNQEALADLINGTLKNEETWEALLSSAGSSQAAKAVAWHTLLVDGKLPYFALLKNLRNIAEQAPKSLEYALQLLTNEAAIKKSLVLPFRFVTAYKQIQEANHLPSQVAILNALSQAVDISTVNNLDRLPGRTLVVLDTSGSMVTVPAPPPGMKPNLERTPANVGSLFAAALLKANPQADLITFAYTGQYQSVSRNAPVLSVNDRVRSMMNGGGTNIGSAFSTANKPYDNIIILSDGGHNWNLKNTNDELERYKRTFRVNPKIFNFDLSGYGTLQFPQENVYSLFGFSDRILVLINHLIEDKEALLNAIGKVDFKDNAVREEA